MTTNKTQTRSDLLNIDSLDPYDCQAILRALLINTGDKFTDEQWESLLELTDMYTSDYDTPRCRYKSPFASGRSGETSSTLDHINRLVDIAQGSSNDDTPDEVARIIELTDYMRKNQWSNDVNLASDMNSWQKELNEHERLVLKRVFQFFAFGDYIVGTLVARHLQRYIYDEQRALFVAWQLTNESVHQQVYNTMISQYAPESMTDVAAAFRRNQYPALKAKLEYVVELYTYHESPWYGFKLFAQLIIEGLYFSASFMHILRFRRHPNGAMAQLVVANDYIRADEGCHYNFYLGELRASIAAKNPVTRTYLVERLKLGLRRATELEMAASDEVLDGIPDGAIEFINKESMRQYIMSRANVIASDLFGEPLYIDGQTGLAICASEDHCQIIPPERERVYSNFFETKNINYPTNVGVVSASDISDLVRAKLPTTKKRHRCDDDDYDYTG